jgi:hypothetical protein
MGFSRTDEVIFILVDKNIDLIYIVKYFFCRRIDQCRQKETDLSNCKCFGTSWSGCNFGLLRVKYGQS